MGIEDVNPKLPYRLFKRINSNSFVVRGEIEAHSPVDVGEVSGSEPGG